MTEQTLGVAASLPKVIITRFIVGVAHMQVCASADATDEDILALCNAENPSGTTKGWTTVDRTDRQTGPVQCKSDPTRTHFLVGC
jgi:hypothetical protein